MASEGAAREPLTGKITLLQQLSTHLNRVLARRSRATLCFSLKTQGSYHFAALCHPSKRRNGARWVPRWAAPVGMTSPSFSRKYQFLSGPPKLQHLSVSCSGGVAERGPQEACVGLAGAGIAYRLQQSTFARVRPLGIWQARHSGTAR